MSYNASGLVHVQQGGATAAGTTKVLREWMYATDDAAATVEAANYFNAAAGVLTKGDIILASMVRSGTPVGKSYIVTANSGTVVTVAAFS